MKRTAIRRFPIQAVLAWVAALVVVPMPFTAILWATLGPMYRSMLTPITAGIYAYIWMLECVWLGCRPRWLDRIIGLPGIYVLHGVLGTGALALVVYHQYVLPSFGPAKTTGEIAFWTLVGIVALALVMMAGWLDTLVPPLATVRSWLERVFRHEFTVWLHRIVLVAVVLACLHFNLVFYIKDLTAFIVTMNVTTGLVLAWYAWVKLRDRMFAARGKVVSARRVSNDIVEILVDCPAMRSWEYGDFVFLRLPRERGMHGFHPFSIANLPGEHGDAMRFAVRINGDFTERLYRTARAGMRVDVIGPFGMYERFIARHDAHAPIVVYAGGVGITPIIPTIMALSGTNRPVTVMYTAKRADDLLYADELRKWSASEAHTLHMQVGRWSKAELAEQITDGAIYLIAGPSGMIRDVRRMLLRHGVPGSRMFYEPFTW